MSSIYNMKLHDVIAVNPNAINNCSTSKYSVMRVHNGWIYQSLDCYCNTVIETFVPDNNNHSSSIEKFIDEKVEYINTLGITDSIDSETLINICEEYHKMRVG